MNNLLKNWAKLFIPIGIFMFLIPAIAGFFSRDNQQRNDLLSSVSISMNILQIAGIFLALCSSIVLLVLILKEKRSGDILRIVNTKDPAWNLESLQYHTRSIFYKLQSSLKKKDTVEMIDYATPEFILWLNKIIQKPGFIADSQIDIIETRIICCQDYMDNGKDKFVSYIKGNISDNNSASQNEFSGIFHFIRQKNDWLLDQINVPSIWNLLLFQSKVEE